MTNIYEIVDSFQIKNQRILVLNREYDSFAPEKKERVLIDGKEYVYRLSSIKTWIAIESNENFKGKQAQFI